MYVIYHGAPGIKNIAKRIHLLTLQLENELSGLGIEQMNAAYFDTLKLNVQDVDKIKALAEQHEINFNYFKDGTIGISLDETTTMADVAEIVKIFAEATGKKFTGSSEQELTSYRFPVELKRTSTFLLHAVFNTHHSESQMMRYIKFLENKDLSLNTSMISLGSCTMKLNAATELMPVSWPEFSKLHPFAPTNQTLGYQQVITELENYLSTITGFAATSLQPNSGAQGEYAGLLAIRAYHESNGGSHRDVILIPISAHGTNPASAVMAGMKVVVTKCDEAGNIDVADLKEKAEEHKNDLAGLMVTYPSTHGVFEESIREICDTIHAHGGQVYMDGANMNAQVGLTSPGMIGADVCHLNLHKTFSIPHGGGGPGIGPICCSQPIGAFFTRPCKS
jgi:glycine dehydrogenase